MSKKSVSATILILFLALTFSVIGACFMTFVYKDTKIEFDDIKVIASNGIQVFDDEKMTNKINELKLSDMKLGLKPATGELDPETKIPSTITDEGTSEGYYETIYVKSSSAFKVVINNIEIDNDKDENKANAQREFIFVAIKGVNDSTKSLEQNEIEIASFDGSGEPQKITFLFWLDALSGEELVGSEISFDINLIAV